MTYVQTLQHWAQQYLNHLGECKLVLQCLVWDRHILTWYTANTLYQRVSLKHPSAVFQACRLALWKQLLLCKHSAVGHWL